MLWILYHFWLPSGTKCQGRFWVWRGDRENFLHFPVYFVNTSSHWSLLGLHPQKWDCIVILAWTMLARTMQSALIYGRVVILLLTGLRFSLFQGFSPILESSCCNIMPALSTLYIFGSFAGVACYFLVELTCYWRRVVVLSISSICGSGIFICVELLISLFLSEICEVN